jgi:two-component system, OmpR family, alkaline phosphatase synthesis response regulator PhoP
MEEKDKRRILVVEDEMHIAEGLRLNLSLQGYAVRVAGDGVSGLHAWEEWRPDLIVLDIMLPGIDGLSVLQHIRLKDERIPILILSAKTASDDKIKGLSFGVDDYLTKPFNLEEFLLRVDRLMKRVSWSRNGAGDPAAPGTYTFGGNRIDFKTLTADCRAGKVQLTEQEGQLLKLFITHRGKPLSRHRLLEIGWGYTRTTTTRTVDNFIVRLRKYFEENPKKPVYFKSLRAVGYIFDHPPEGALGADPE